MIQPPCMEDTHGGKPLRWVIIFNLNHGSCLEGLKSSWNFWTKNKTDLFWLVVSTHLKNISQNGNLPQIEVKVKNVWNHHLVLGWPTRSGFVGFPTCNLWCVEPMGPHFSWVRLPLGSPTQNWKMCIPLAKTWCVVDQFGGPGCIFRNYSLGYLGPNII